MLKIGVIVDNLGPNQLAHAVISSANIYLEKNRGKTDFLVFQKNILPYCLRPNFAVMNTSEAFDFDGVLIATDINAASQIVKYPGPKKRIFYSYDLEWLRMQRNYEMLHPIYSHSRLEVWARSNHHARLIEQTWGVKVKNVLENFELSQIVEICK